MNQNRKEELLTRWIDDALAEDERRELEELLAAEPGLNHLKDDFLELRGRLREAIPAATEPPYPDFFNSHLERHLESLRQGGGEPSRSGSPLLSRLWSWWLAPAAAASLVVAFLAGMYSQPGSVPPPLAEATAAYSPLANVTAEAVQDESLDATVIVLSGLEELSDENLIGWSGSRNEETPVYITARTLY